MKRPSVVVLVAAGALAVAASAIQAGPEKIAFPANYKDHVLYATLDRYDTKQYRELYGTPEAVRAAKEGKPIPSEVSQWPTIPQLFVKGELVAFTVMEKRAGWGAENPDDLRNGEWEYSALTAEGKFNDKANFKGCFQCHKPHEKQDYVISLAKLAGTFPTGPVAMRTGASDVNIAGFAFGPNKLTVGPGQSVTWTNADDSPHQIAFPKTQERSPVLLKGQSHTQTLATPGTYDYICGLHTSMKGTIEVK